MRRGTDFCHSFLVFAALVACTPTDETPPAAEVEAVAIYRGGVVTAADLDQAVLDLPSQQRLALQAADLEPFRELTGSLVWRRLLLAEARQLGLDQAPELLAEIDGLHRQALATSYLNKALPPLEQPTETELLTAFEDQRERFDQPEARSVFHLFRRLTGMLTKDELVAQVRDVRRRVAAGESFALLAAELSDSESRHQEGFIGRIVPGQLPIAFEQVIFGLDEKVPSEPIVTSDGAHLFFVDAIVPARTTSFDEARSMLRRDLLARQRADAVSAIVEAIELPPGSFVPETDELMALLRAGDPKAVVLRLGDFEMRLGKFRRLVAREEEQLPLSQKLLLRKVMPSRVFAALWQREMAVLAARRAGEELAPDAAAELEVRAESVMLERYQRQLLGRQLDSMHDRLEAYYEGNKKRFSSPLRLQIRRLTLPLTEDASAKMAELESLRAEARAGVLDLAAAGARLGGEFEDLGLRSLDQLTQADPKMALFAGRMARGDVSPPYTTATGELAIFEITRRQEPEILPFQQADTAVRSAFLQRHGRELYHQLISDKLSDVDFTLDEERLAAVVTSWVSGSAASDSPSSSVAVEEGEG